MLFVQIAHIIIGLYIFLLAMRMFVSSRDAYFNPLFSAVFKATEPVMVPVRRAFQRGPRDLAKADFTPLVPMILLVIVDGALPALFVPGISFLMGIVLRVVTFVDYAFLVFIVLLLIFSAFYKYSRSAGNVFLRGAFKIMEPAYVTVGRLGKFTRDHSGVVLFVLSLILYIVIISIILPLQLSGGYSMFAANPIIIVEIVVRHALFNLLSLVTFFTYVIIIGALMSWISPDPMNPIVQIIQLLSEPLNRQVRRVVPLIGGIDISPIFSILALQLIARYGVMAIMLITPDIGARPPL